MKTELTSEQAEQLAELLERPSEFAEFMGITQHTDISEMSVEQIAKDAEISVEEAELILIAAIIADKPSIWGAFEFAFNF